MTIKTDKKPVFMLVGPDSIIHKGGIAQFFSAFAKEFSNCQQSYYLTWKRMYPSFLLKRDFIDKVSKEKILNTRRSLAILDFYNPFSLITFLYVLRKKRITHLILNWAHPVHALHYIVILLSLRFFSKVKTCLICHNVNPHESFIGSKFLSNLVFRLVDKIVVHSAEESRKLEDLNINPVKTIKLFMPLFDMFSVSVSQDVSASFQNHLLFFGMIREYKGVDIILRAIRILKDEDFKVKVTIAGEYFYKNEMNLFQLAKELNIEDEIEFKTHYIANEEIPEIFQTVDAVIFPFRSVTQSASLTLAFSFNKPAIVSNLPTFLDIIEDGYNGCIFETESASSLAKAIKRFYEYPDMKSNVEDFKKRLSWNNYISSFLNEIES